MNHSIKRRRQALHQTHHHYYLNISVEAAKLSDWRIESNRIKTFLPELECSTWNSSRVSLITISARMLNKYGEFWTNRSYEVVGYSGAMCNKYVHSTMTLSYRFRYPTGVKTNGPRTTCGYHHTLIYQRLAVANYLSPQCRNYVILITILREHLPLWYWDCTWLARIQKFEVFNVSC